jgi:hypothetical protein
MRRTGGRTIFGAAVTLCASVLAAAPALAAKEFHASEVGKEFTPASPGVSKGEGVGIQDFKFGAFHIQCESVKAKGKVGANDSKTFFTSVKYKGCKTLARLGNQPITLKTQFKSNWDFEYHANGFAEIGPESESELKLLKGGSIEMKVPSIGCVIEVPAQTIPIKAEAKPENEFSSVLYANEEIPVAPSKKFPTGVQKQLRIINDLKKIEYELSEGQCETFKQTEGKNSFYKGQLKEMVRNGNLFIA